MDSSTMRRRLARSTAVVAAAALALGGGFALAAPANAAETSVTDAVFRWGINNESNSAAFAPGTFNLLSAGVVTATSPSDRVTAANWQQSDGDTRILKLQSDGSYAAATFAGLNTDAAGTRITTGNGLSSGHIVEIGAGTGTVDPAAGTAEIQWSGTFTSAYYSGMTRSWITDPRLSVAADGTGTLTATLGGYGTSMDDPEKFETLAPVEDVTIATLANVEVDADGFSVTPDYLGRTVDVGAGSPQVTTGPAAGAFPQEFVDFQVKTGQGPYWYSTGGAADARKPATALSVAYTAAPVVAAPAVTVSKSSQVDPAGEVVTVSGAGFLPAGTATTGTRPPLAGKFTGAYVVFGKFLDTWKPTADAPSSARKGFVTKWALPAESIETVGGANAGAIELKADGTFSVDLTVLATDENNLLAGNYGIYTYAAGGPKYAPFETFTPLTFLGEGDVVVEVPEQPEEPSGSFGWDFASSSPANLGVAAPSGANFAASGSLSNIEVSDTRTGGSSPYSWSVSGQAGDFAAGAQTFSSGFLGWAPKVVAGGASVTAGDAVTSTQTGGTGLASSRVLASSTAAASATIGADLTLVIPGTTAAGAYTSKITITALAN
ncbi:hypothetical protein ACFXQA_04010 [Microbacterium sp. P07]|uniref:hypothetical protein n=1 Tax=Microbacterium sp. P07 TaxID=3366952 RepID=UPI003746D918